MALITTMNLKGISGKTYNFNIYPIHQKFTFGSGIYCITRRYSKNPGEFKHDIVYIGMTGDICERFTDHHKDQCFVINDANCIGIHSDSNEASRREKELDLIHSYTPKCNG